MTAQTAEVLLEPSSPYDELARIAARLHGRMVATAHRLLRDEDEARDAVQDAYVQALRGLGRFERRAQLSTWLHQIVVNAALMRLRSRRRLRIEPLDGVDGHASVTDEAPGPEERVLQAQDRGLVRRCLADLPAHHRTVLVLRDLEHLDTVETAARLRVKPSTLKVRLHRARRALRTRLEPQLAS